MQDSCGESTSIPGVSAAELNTEKDWEGSKENGRNPWCSTEMAPWISLQSLALQHVYIHVAQLEKKLLKRRITPTKIAFWTPWTPWLPMDPTTHGFPNCVPLEDPELSIRATVPRHPLRSDRCAGAWRRDRSWSYDWASLIDTWRVIRISSFSMFFPNDLPTIVVDCEMASMIT